MADPSKAFEVFNMVASKYEALTAGISRELARYLIEISPKLDDDSIVLDNACGTGVVAQEVLLKRFAAGASIPQITCVDVAPAMVDLARDVCRGMIESRHAGDASKITAEVMPGENLQLPDDHFTHSFTNQGIMFFKDPAKGSREIIRTLQRAGTAVVTSWTKLGHIEVIHAAQKAYKSDAPLMKFPLSEQWFQASYLERTLMNAGFAEVDVHEKTVWYAAKSTEELSGLMFAMFENFPVGWNEEENKEFKKYLDVEVEKAVVKVTRPIAGDVDGKTEELVGVPMVALVAVAKK
jgi:ubiquinone/menaquinone biosynthesis C-methylase UbiE